jgi:tRNA(Ile2) C34 agmatinyltransferase TiaS
LSGVWLAKNVNALLKSLSKEVRRRLRCRRCEKKKKGKGTNGFHIRRGLNENCGNDVNRSNENKISEWLARGPGLAARLKVESY